MIAAPSDDELEDRRRRMVESQIRARGIQDVRVLEAMIRVPRHRFVKRSEIDLAYGDYPIDIGRGQTISQPYIVGYMTEALQLEPEDRMLEIGTGSGYQTAVLAELVRDVYSIEIVPELSTSASALLEQLGYRNVHLKVSDGYRGWAEAAPFDGAIVAAAAEHIPRPIADQLATGARLVVPIGKWDQDLLVLTKTEHGLREESRIPVRFVPFTRGPGEPRRD